LSFINSSATRIEENKGIELKMVAGDDYAINKNLILGGIKIVESAASGDITSAFDIKIKNNSISLSESSGITLRNVKNIDIKLNRIFGNTTDGVYAYDCENFNVYLNKIYANGRNGININYSENTQVFLNEIIGHIKIGEQRNASGIHGFGLNNYTIAYNYLKRNCTGIRVFRSKHGKISGNKVTNNECRFTGIHLQDSNPIIMNNNIINNNGSGIFAEAGSNPKVNINNIFANGYKGIKNGNSDITIDAQNNWWGDASGPGDNGFEGNVNAANWLSSPVDLVVGHVRDTVWVMPADMDSVFCSATNLSDSTDVLEITLSDKEGWLTEPKHFEINLADTSLNAVFAHYVIPSDVQTGNTDWVKMSVVSKNHQGVTAVDSFVLATYASRLKKITVYPDSVTIVKGDSVLFNAYGFDQYGKLYDFHAKWNASAGKIDSTGKFMTDSTMSGIVRIIASNSSAGISDTAFIFVADNVPKLTKLIVKPDSVTLKPFGVFQFIVHGRNQYNFPHFVRPVWSASGGEISQDGFYQADSVLGTFYVIALDTATELSDTAVVIVEKMTGIEEEIVPERFALYQNFPNPFNPSTTLEYSLPHDSRVKLEIFNILGQRVKVLVDKIEKVGLKRVVWNANNFASGVYFVRIYAVPVDSKFKSYSTVKKMIMLK
jgi:parallel beta-helix repeat protein